MGAAQPVADQNLLMLGQVPRALGFRRTVSSHRENSSTATEARTTLRPSRQHVPVRRFTLTLRHASELLTPIEINRMDYVRLPTRGPGPRVPFSPSLIP